AFVSRAGHVGIAAPVAASETGELDVPGIGRLTPASFTRTETGLFAYGMFEPGCYRVSAFEWGGSGVEDSDDIPLEELAAARHRAHRLARHLRERASPGRGTRDHAHPRPDRAALPRPEHHRPAVAAHRTARRPHHGASRRRPHGRRRPPIPVPVRGGPPAHR